MPSSKSWLFLRGDESIQVVRTGQGLIVLSVRGPGPAKAFYTFDDDRSSLEFLNTLEKGLVAAHWSYEGPDVERRKGTDRRASARSLEDRRRRW